MKISIQLLFLLILSTMPVVTAKSFKKNVTHVSYEVAEKAANTVYFEISSTKVFLITTHPRGYAGSFEINAELNGRILEFAEIIIPIAELDSDNSLRDGRMRNEILDIRLSSVIVAAFDEPVDLSKNGEYVLNGTLFIRGETKPIRINLNVLMAGDGLTISGRSDVKLSSLGIPDPSILVASVADEAKIVFRFEFDVSELPDDFYVLP